MSINSIHASVPHTSIVFVHAGENTPPEHLIDALIIVNKVAPHSMAYLLISRLHIQLIRSQLSLLSQFDLQLLSVIAIEDVAMSATTKHFFANAKIDRSFRDGFWFSASYRFFLLADFMEQHQIENCIHLENDVVLYFDPSDKVEQFRNFARFSVPLDRVRAIPGIVWFKDSQIATELAQFISERSDMNDMDTLGEFCLRKDIKAKPLPTLPLAYALAKGLELEKYCAGIEDFGGIFDAAAIGQYVRGVHWMNNPEDTRFFVNESSDLDMRQCQFLWAHHDSRYPMLGFERDLTPILSLHIHSKDLHSASPFNSGVPDKLEQVITGHRIQALADLTISSDEVTAFEGRDNIQSKSYIQIPVEIEKRLFKRTKIHKAPDLAFVQQCQRAEVLFVYTHVVPYFKKWIAPRLHKPFILISHNSDNEVSIEDLDLLNHPQLIAWFAQNVKFNHSKLKALPIGLPNNEWHSEHSALIYNSTRAHRKTKSIYINLSNCSHADAKAICDAITGLPQTVQSNEIPYEQYIAKMAEHRFCLCPRGNSIDTYRFWEAQYVDCIPVILKEDWTQAYSNLPVLLLDSWAQLKAVNLDRKYIEISTKSYGRSSLTMHFYQKEIESLKAAIKFSSTDI